METVLRSIQLLLANPVPDDPQDAVVASQYTRDQEMFRKTAIYWTSIYAESNQVVQEMVDMVAELISKGFGEVCIVTLV